MGTVSIRPNAKLWALLFLLQTAYLPSLVAQFVRTDIDNSASQADYVIICPTRYTTIMQDLAVHRQSFNGFRVAIVTTEAIYQIFGQGVRADSSIRAFITYALTSWSNPKPQYFLLAGNVNTIPSHREPGIGIVNEDSIFVDQWFVEGINDTTFSRPAAALGRFPGWDEGDMSTLTEKTILYEQQPDAAWRNRAIAVSDYRVDVGNTFEVYSQSLLQSFSGRWRDTLSVHVRTDSPLHRTREEFRSLWNQGSCFIWFSGFTSGTQFSSDAYFLTSDVDSLANNTPLAMTRFVGSQRFENRDTIPFVSKLLLTAGKGSVCTLAPSGLAYANETYQFGNFLIQQLAGSPGILFGRAILNVKRIRNDDQFRKETLLGDPALTVRNAMLANADDATVGVPTAFVLHQNYPNPFNPTTIIAYELPKDAVISLAVFDILGREVARLGSGFKKAGKYDVTFDASSLSSGMYVYRLQAGETILSRKMMVTK